MRSISIWLFMVMNLADGLTTAVGLRMGLPEGNPIAAVVLAAWGPVAMFALKFGLLSLVVLCVARVGHRYRRLYTALAGCSVLLAAVVACNLFQIL